MRAYISVSYAKAKALVAELKSIESELTLAGIEPWIFVSKHKFSSAEEAKMMQQAFIDIDKSDFLIAECTFKAIGIGIEAGYAKARSKPVIYLRHSHAEHSTTMSGLSEFSIIYKDSDDLALQLRKVMAAIQKGKR
ncbi:MAG TPA: nucleoside 2-deoxyribosyltransferase [Cyclobacteriaceae bacterium]|nr:nucleoside 2-deoxyribosyltransferase [Cyclobacteriaceae bacterium]